MSDLFGNHIVGFPMRRLIFEDFPISHKTIVFFRFDCDCNSSSLIRKHACVIYRIFFVLKMKIFTGKNVIFFLFLLKT